MPVGTDFPTGNHGFPFRTSLRQREFTVIICKKKTEKNPKIYDERRCTETKTLSVQRVSIARPSTVTQSSATKPLRQDLTMARSGNYVNNC